MLPHSSLSQATVSGFGWMDRYMGDVVNAGLKEQHLFEAPLLDALNEVSALIVTRASLL